MALDNRPAVTRYACERFDAQKNQSLVRVRPITGRRHQIRRHFDAIEYPVMGDPRYGQSNKNTSGLKLFASGLGFERPLGNGLINIMIDSDHFK